MVPSPGHSWDALPLGPRLWSFWLCWGVDLWLPLTLVSRLSVLVFSSLFLSSMPAGFPVLPLPPFPPPFLTTPFSPCRFLGGPGEDLERNDGSQERPYFMSPELRDILLKGSAEEGKQEEVEE